MPNNTYDNWKAITESDFVTLFIKTWFAYISTLRTMFPEAQNKRGDKKYLNAYKDFYKRNGFRNIIIDESLMNSIEIIYRNGRNIILQQYPEYYFSDFYRLNDDFQYNFKDIPPNKKDCMVVGLKLYRVRGTKFSYKLTGFAKMWGTYYQLPYDELLKFEFNLKEVLDNIKDHISGTINLSEQDFLSWLVNEVQVGISTSIVNKFGELSSSTTLSSSIKKKLLSKQEQVVSLIRNIFTMNMKDETNKTSTEMQVSRNMYEIFQQRPVNYFEYHMESEWMPNRKLSSFEERWYHDFIEAKKKYSLIWYLDFVYRLRNALFHEILDPLDPQWQTIFKNSYLVLKEIVDGNIAYLQQIERTDIE